MNVLHIKIYEIPTGKKKPQKTPTKQQHILHHNIIFVKCMCNLKKNTKKTKNNNKKPNNVTVYITCVWHCLYCLYGE